MVDVYIDEKIAEFSNKVHFLVVPMIEFWFFDHGVEFTRIDNSWASKYILRKRVKNSEKEETIVVDFEFGMIIFQIAAGKLIDSKLKLDEHLVTNGIYCFKKILSVVSPNLEALDAIFKGKDLNSVNDAHGLIVINPSSISREN